LAKCFHVKLWENSPYVSKQLSGIGNVMSSQLVTAGKTSFQLLAECDPREIELVKETFFPPSRIHDLFS
jgi:ATP-dependent DNA helicase HFM1/MER3